MAPCRSGRGRRSRFRRTAGAITIAVAMTALVSSGQARAAPSPSPTVAPGPSGPTLPPPGNDFGLMAWLDATLPLDVAPGTRVRVGAFVWSEVAAAVLPSVTLRATIKSASGGTAATAYAAEDWPGHVVAELTVPDGGVGGVEIALPGTICDAAGTCVPQDTPIPIVGVGPPTGVPLATIGSAFIDPPAGAPVAGEPVTFEVGVEPRVAWPAPGLILPDTIWLQVRVLQGPIVDDVAATLVDAGAGRYEARVTFNRAGQFVVQVATAEGAEGADLFSTALRQVVVEAAPGPSSGPGSGATDGESMPGWAFAGLVGLLIVGVGLMVLGRARGQSPGH
jgi:hypothetical protein